MGKRDRIRRAFQGLGNTSKKASASESTTKSATTIAATTLEPPCLKEPTDATDGAPSAGSRSQDVTVKDLWGLALEKLSPEEKDAVSQVASDSKLEILRHLRTAAEEKRKNCEDQRWKFEVNGRKIVLRDVAQKIIIWIDKFKQIGDIAVNFDPVHASLPWAGIRLLLEVG